MVCLQDVDVIFREGMVEAHGGPRFGIEDARQILGVFCRPLVGTIVKPRVGLDPAAIAAVADAVVRGVLDLETVISALEKLEKEIDKRAFYAGFFALEVLSRNVNVPVHVHAKCTEPFPETKRME
jgi:ribulose 1,5-bisphosphate carboxylase large subunit-like protein